MKPKFKVGDKVVIKNQKGEAEYLNGKKGTIEDTYLVGLNKRRCYILSIEDNNAGISKLFIASARELDFADAVHNKLGCNVFLSISVQDAREMYKNGNEVMRKLLLLVYTEDELDPKPKCWNDRDMVRCEDFLNSISDPLNAYVKLLALRNEWIGDWRPVWQDYTNPSQSTPVGNFCIIHQSSDFKICELYCDIRPLSFPTKEMATEFINCFANLLERAKGLY